MPTRFGFRPFTPGAGDDPMRRISALDPKLSRSNYFDGKLLRASDLVRDQLYLDERLREAGRALGSGIVRGFEVSLSLEGDLSVTPGLAIAPSGRVLEHEGPDALTVNLFDTARFSVLNPGGVERLTRGLYAVAARLTRRAEGVAEVFPADLAERSGFNANAYTEGVELVLAPLDTRLPSRARREAAGGGLAFRGVADRAALARELLGNTGQPRELDEDAVALALLAVDGGGPVWLDSGLVRRAFRPPGEPGAEQAVLMAHHDELLAAVIAERAAAGRTGAFAASDYFDRLPPAGAMPPGTVNPAEGTQRFFPPHFAVSVAPVRADDLPAILDEAALLDPIELSGRAPVHVMVLAPLSDGVFDGLARRLELDPTERDARDTALRAALEALEEAGGDADGPAGDEVRARLADVRRFALARGPITGRRLPSLAPLVLRARGGPPALDTDVAAWAAIQAEVERTGALWFVRRAPRAAATDVSAVVAARGVALPPLADAEPTDVDRLRTELAEAEEARDAAVAEVGELTATVRALRERLEEAGDAGEEALTEARERVARLEAALREAQARIARLEEAVGEGRTFERERNEARLEVERLRTALADTSATDALRAEIRRLEGSVAAANTKATEAERRLARSRLDVERLVESRRITDPGALEAARTLAAEAEPEEAVLVARAAALAPASADSALWPSLLEARRAGSLGEFVAAMDETLASDRSIEDVGRRGADLGLSPETMRLWRTEQPQADADIRGAVPTGGAFVADRRLTERMVVAPELRRVAVSRIRSIDQLAASRNYRRARVLSRLKQLVGSDRTLLAAVNLAAAATDTRYDDALWPSLVHTASKGTLPDFAKFLQAQVEAGRPLGLAVGAGGGKFLVVKLRDMWGAVDMG